MKDIIITGKSASMVCVIFLIIAIGITIGANSGKQHISTIISISSDGSPTRIDDNNNGLVDLVETAHSAPFYNSAQNTTCPNSDDLILGFDEDGPLCQSLDDLWGEMKKNCKVITGNYNPPGRGHLLTGYTRCPDNMELLQVYVSGSYGQLLCC